MGQFMRVFVCNYLGEGVHDLRQHIRVWLCTDSLDEGVAHEVPHLGEVLGTPHTGTLQKQGHGLCSCHPHP